MKERWRKGKVLLVGMMCLGMLKGSTQNYVMPVYGAAVEKQAGSGVIEEIQHSNGTEMGSKQQSNNSEMVEVVEDKKNGQESSKAVVEGEKNAQGTSEAQGSNGEKASSNEKSNGGKSGKNQEVTDPKQVILTLVALFGLGSFFAVLLSVSYKIYLSKKVVALPVLYYGKREEGLYE